jgi:hypothetical protein
MTNGTVTIDTIKEDLAALQSASDAAVATIDQLSGDISVTQEQLDNLHAGITGVTSDLNDAVAGATPAGDGR